MLKKISCYFVTSPCYHYRNATGGNGHRLVLPKRCDIPFGGWLLFKISWAELMKLTSTMSQSMINALKALFARHDIPSQLRTDNRPQFASAKMETFSKAYGFEHTTSSPWYPQSNGRVERTVRTVRNLFKKADDMYLALLVHRSTTLQWCNRNPAVLCKGTWEQTYLKYQAHLSPTGPTMITMVKLISCIKCKERVKRNFDQRHRVATLLEISDGSTVLVRLGKSKVRQVIPFTKPMLLDHTCI